MQNPPGSSSKTPEIILGFWLIKIAATTMGETGGDTLSMSLHLGYLLSTAIFFVLLVTLVTLQIRARGFHAFLYWAAIIATTLTGTTIADYADRSLGIGYIGGSLLVFTLLLACLAAWRRATGSVSVAHITSTRNESFYWATILFSNTLGTALGDLVASDTGLGFAGGAMFFAALIAAVAVLYFTTRLSHSLLFWAAFILTRPLGATLGDLLTKPFAHGGFDLSRPASSAAIGLLIILGICCIPQRASGQPAGI